MMRRLLLYFLLLASFTASAQTLTTQYLGGNNTLVLNRGPFKTDGSFYLAVMDTTFAPLYVGAMVYRSADNGVYVSISTVGAKKWEKLGNGGGTAAWGNISGNINSQSDLMALLNAKQNLITTGTVSQYIRGNLSLGDFASDVLSLTDGAYASLTHSHDGLLPPGGTAGQILMKNSGLNFDYFWGTPPSGGGTITSVFGRTGAISAQSSDYASYYKAIGWFPAFNEITSKPNTLAGYGITDAYTQTQVVSFFTGTTPITGYNKTNWDAVYSWYNGNPLTGYATQTWVGQNYKPLSYVPAWSEVTGKPTFATVATTGSYNDLADRPAVTDGWVAVGTGTSLYGSAKLTYKNDLLKVTNGTGEMAYPYETIVAERSGPVEMGVYTATTDTANVLATRYGAGYATAFTKLKTEGYFPGFEMQHIWGQTRANNFLRFNYVQRGSDGWVVSGHLYDNLMRLYGDGRLQVATLQTDTTAPVQSGIIEMVTTDENGQLSRAPIPNGGGGTATAPTITTSAAPSLTLSTATTNEKTYVFTGTGDATWTLPLVSASSSWPLNIKNRGTALLTLQREGSDQIFYSAATNSITLLPGEAMTFQSDGTYFIAF